MASEDGFLDAIRAAPEDAALPRIFADWLEERGDPRAEYLRLLSPLDTVGDTAAAAPEFLARLHKLQFEQRISRGWIELLCMGRITRLLREYKEGAERQDWLQHEQYRQLALRFDALSGRPFLPRLCPGRAGNGGKSSTELRT